MTDRAVSWKQGFQTGVKSSLNSESKLSIEQFQKLLDQAYFDDLVVMMNVGRDEPNGIWRMLGARMGVYMTLLTEWDPVNAQNEAALEEIWISIESSDAEIVAGTVAEELVEQLKLPIVKLTVEDCKFIKHYLLKNPH